MHNRKSRVKSAAGYKGISFDKGWGKWRAFISIDKKNKHLGSFTSDTDAARAYDAAARIYHGEFAYLNFPDEVSA